MNADPLNKDVLISGPRGSLGLTLAGVIQAWRYGVDSDLEESTTSDEVDLGDLAIIDDKHKDYDPAHSYEAAWRRVGPAESRRRISMTAL